MGIGPHPAAIARTSNEARGARSPGELALLNDPEAGRRAIMGAQARGGQDLKRFWERSWRAAWAAWTRRDWEVNTLLMDDGHVFNAGTGAQIPGIDARLVGVEGYLQGQERLQAEWSDISLSVDAVLACDESTVTTSMRWLGTGRGSGVGIDQLGLCLSVFEEGAVVEQTYWMDRAAGLAALGMDPDRGD